MTDDCTSVRDLAPEVALEIAEARERALVLDHVATCSSCAAHLMELSATADDMLALAPMSEPPSGFESSVLEHLRAASSSRAMATPARRWMRSGPRLRIALVAAVIVLATTLAAGAVHWTGRADRALADGVRQTLATSHGQYFIAFPLQTADAQRRGAVFAYEGDPSWVVLTLDQPVVGGPHVVELLGRDGVTRQVADNVDLTADRVWGAQIPIAVHDAATLTVVDAHGRTALTADLAAPPSS